VNAVLNARKYFVVPEIKGRLEALAQVRPTSDFEPLAASCKRIRNILKQANFKFDYTFDKALLEEGPERELHAKLMDLKTKNEPSYYKRLLQVAAFRPLVDKFFDEVMVNVPDEKLRTNRLTLLHELLTEFSTIADFSEIVTSGDQK
jgi:glycyl-tRNA synthetase beta chain